MLLRDFQLIEVCLRGSAFFLTEAGCTGLFFFGSVEEEEVVGLFIAIVQIMVDVVRSWLIVVLLGIFDKKLEVNMFFLLYYLSVL
jgi:hypothetical protein